MRKRLRVELCEYTKIKDGTMTIVLSIHMCTTYVYHQRTFLLNPVKKQVQVRRYMSHVLKGTRTTAVQYQLIPGAGVHLFVCHVLTFMCTCARVKQVYTCCKCK